MLPKLKRVDWTIPFILLIFMAVGTAILHSAVYSDPKFTGVVSKNIIFYCIGFFVMFLCMLIDYRWMMRWVWGIYGLGIASLIGLYFFGVYRNHARRSYELAGFSIQPAEIVKITLILILAHLLYKRRGEPLQFWRDVIPIGLVTLVPFVLVMDQPDLGNAIIYIIILLAMLWIGNVKLKYVLTGLIIIGVCVGSFLYFYETYHFELTEYLKDHNKGHWMKRIDTFLKPEESSRDAIYQVKNSKIAIGSGALLGEGYLKGQYVQNRSIPYPYSDSIFVVVGEEFGFVGSSALLLLYFLLLYRLILVAIQATDPRGAFIVVGVVAMLVFQVYENIGMLIGLMPLTGINLPFISYGGSSLTLNMLSIGIILSISAHSAPNTASE